MSDVYIPWKGDVVKIPQHVSYTADDKFIPYSYRAGKRNWVVTKVDMQLGRVYLGAYRGFGLHYAYYPPLELNFEDVQPVNQVCRHSNRTILPGSRPTCLTVGKRQGTICTDCGVVIKEQEIIPAREHLFEYDYDKNIRTCILCKHEESIPERSLVIKRGDIRALVNLVENMVEDTVTTTSETVKPYPAPDYNLMSEEVVHEFNDYQYQLNYQLFCPTAEEGSSMADDLQTYKYPLIVWFSDTPNNTPFRYLVEEGESSRFETSNTILDGYAAFVMVALLKGSDWKECKAEFFATLNHIINSNNIDERKIILMGAGTNSVGSQLMMYQDPDMFSYQVIIDGHDSLVDIKSLNDRADTTLLVRTAEGRSDYHTELEKNYGQSLTPSGANEFTTLSAALNEIFDNHIEYMLQKISPRAQAQDDAQNGILPDTDPFEITVTEHVLPLRSSASISAELVGLQELLYGQSVTIDKVTENQNYTWGRLDAKYFDPIPEAEYTTLEAECWIPLELTSRDPLTVNSYIVPCCYESILRTVREYRRNDVDYQHNGYDLKAPWGTPVFATAAGIISSISTDIEFGGSITIDHEDGKKSFYAHIIPIQELTVGANVAAGQFLAQVGGTNGTTTPEPHLHFGIQDSDGSWISPAKYVEFYR